MELVGLFLTLLLALIVLGVVVSFSPTLVVTELAVLTKSKQPFMHSVALIGGIATAVALFCLISVYFIDPSQNIDLPSTREVANEIPLIDLVCGVTFLFIGARMLRQPSSDHAKASQHFNPDKLMNTRTLYWFGLLKMTTSLSSIAAILVAARLIKTSFDIGSLQVAAVLWLVLVSILPFVLLAAMKLYRPDTFLKVQRVSDKTKAYNWRLIVAFTLILAGLSLVYVGIRAF